MSKFLSFLIISNECDLLKFFEIIFFAKCLLYLLHFLLANGFIWIKERQQQEEEEGKKLVNGRKWKWVKKNIKSFIFITEWSLASERKCYSEHRKTLWKPFMNSHVSQLKHDLNAKILHSNETHWINDSIYLDPIYIYNAFYLFYFS